MAEQPDGRGRANLAAAAIVIALLAGGYFLVKEIVRNARLQECLARGYQNCVPVEEPSPRFRP